MATSRVLANSPALKPEIVSLIRSCGLEKFALLNLHSFADLAQNDFARWQEWIKEGHHGSLNYMAEHAEARLNPNLILPNATCAIIFVVPYFRQEPPNNATTSADPLIKNLVARFAHFNDYHFVLKSTLKSLAEKLQILLQTPFEFRPVVDSAPFFERMAARLTGLGGVGMNTLLISPGFGSYTLIASLFMTIPIDLLAADNLDFPASLFDASCNTCMKCLRACPTGALQQPYKLNANRCLSALTIEYKGLIAKEFAPHFQNTIFGCDVCQKVCPHNVALHHNPPPIFKPLLVNSSLSHLTLSAAEGLNKSQFAKIFTLSPIKRMGFEQFKRNLLLHKGTIDGDY